MEGRSVCDNIHMNANNITFLAESLVYLTLSHPALNIDTVELDCLVGSCK